MSTIKGIFEPFAHYVKLQLNIRKVILSNAVGAKLGSGVFAPDGVSALGDGETFIENEELSRTAPIPYAIDKEGRIKATVFAPGEGFQLETRYLPEELFYAYTVEKQSTVRMMSGVDLKPKDLRDTQNGDILEPGEEYLKGSGLAEQYILQGGTLY